MAGITALALLQVGSLIPAVFFCQIWLPFGDDMAARLVTVKVRPRAGVGCRASRGEGSRARRLGQGHISHQVERSF